MCDDNEQLAAASAAAGCGMASRLMFACLGLGRDGCEDISKTGTHIRFGKDVGDRFPSNTVRKLSLP